MLAFVQLPHPGSEHAPNGMEMPWSRLPNHARKFLECHGSFVLGDEVRSGRFTFWGEWEPESVVKSFPAGGLGLPHYLHRPFWRVPPAGEWRQNTDPLVFGERFLYSNCRQQRNAKLRSLAPGSLVLFGSKFGGAFVLDTVFVVGEGAVDYDVARSSGLECQPDVQQVVFGPLREDPDLQHASFRLYRGRMHFDGSTQPYSFVPCMPVEGEPQGFERPRIVLSQKWISPNLAMAAKVTPATNAEVAALWDEVRRQVVAQGFALAIHVDMPAESVF